MAGFDTVDPAYSCAPMGPSAAGWGSPTYHDRAEFPPPQNDTPTLDSQFRGNLIAGKLAFSGRWAGKPRVLARWI